MYIRALTAALVGLTVGGAHARSLYDTLTPRDVPFGREALGQRDLGDIHPRHIFDVYKRDHGDIYARGFSESSELYERDDGLYAREVPNFSGLYERAFSEPYETAIGEIYARDADLYDLYARKAENIYKRELSRLNYLFARAPAGSRPSTPAPNTPPRPGTPSTSHSDSDWSEGSTESAALVGMTRVKTSTSKNVRIIGVNGCTGIFLSGAGFITGAHAAPG